MATNSIGMGAVSFARAETGAWGLPAWYPKAFMVLVLEVFALICIGGLTRLMNAGLACPDWPLCFGDVIPDYHPQVYLEFIHRVMAGLVSIGTLFLSVVLFRSRAPGWIKGLAGLALGILATQVLFGALTVWLQLHSKVVAAHLMLAISFFSTLLWMYLCLRDRFAGNVGREACARWAPRVLALVALAAYGQFLLGGLVASHFASLACTEFPACQGGQWFPTFRGIVGLHLIHRLGAYSLFAITLVSWRLMRRSGSARLERLARISFGLVCLQVGVGIANVLLYTPPIVAVVHLGIGTALLSMMIRQLHAVYGPSAA